MEQLSIARDFVIVLATATVGGLLAHRLRLPIIIGYLIGGIAIGPNGFSVVKDLSTVDALATVGVILLLFALGIEFSLKDLIRLGKTAVLGGIAQVFFTTVTGLALGKLLGFNLIIAVFFGFLIAMSSTTIILRSLMERGELDTNHARVMIGISLVQDLSVVPVMIVMQAFSGEVSNLWASLGIAAIKGVIFLSIMLALGLWGLPWLLKRVVAAHSRELFLLTLFSLALAAAIGSYAFGLSAALGAFMAGLIISESPFARQAFADIVSLRNTFAALFFVSLGMLFSPQFVVEHIVLVVITVIGIIVIKLLVTGVIVRFTGCDPKTVLFVSFGLVPISEFTFVMAQMAMKANLITVQLYDLILAAAAFTMVLTPLFFSTAGFIYRQLSQRQGLAWIGCQNFDSAVGKKGADLSGHAVICGYGRIGENLAKVLKRRKFSFLVIDMDHLVVADLESKGIPAIYGDAAYPEILTHAHLDKARVLVVTYADLVATELTIRNAKQLNPRLDIVARVSRDADSALLKGIGASELVQPDFETSLEITRHTLHRFGLNTVEIQYILNGLRGRGESGEGK